MTITRTTQEWLWFANRLISNFVVENQRKKEEKEEAQTFIAANYFKLMRIDKFNVLDRQSNPTK